MRALTKTLLSLAAAVTVAVSLSACDVPEDGKTHADDVVADAKVKDDPKPEQTKEADPTEGWTAGQKNATASAIDYLDYSAFSKSGLIDQLKYEDYSAKDAKWAVEHINVNWNKQAVAAAKDYLDYDSFSRQGLIEQLQYEGYTPAQATYGVNQAGL